MVAFGHNPDLIISAVFCNPSDSVFDSEDPAHPAVPRAQPEVSARDRPGALWRGGAGQAAAPPPAEAALEGALSSRRRRT